MSAHPQVLRGRGIVHGRAEGPAIVSDRSISFLGDVDIRSGTVTGRMSDLRGRSIAGRVLLVSATRRSAGAWRFLHQLKLHDSHPLAIVLNDLPDPSVVQGAILAAIPIVGGLATGFRGWARDGDRLFVDGSTGEVRNLSMHVRSPTGPAP